MPAELLTKLTAFFVASLLIFCGATQAQQTDADDLPVVKAPYAGFDMMKVSEMIGGQSQTSRTRCA